MEMNFCRRCGSPLTPETGNAYQCANGHRIFDNPNPAAAVYFLSEDNRQVLLCVRGREPRKGMLDTFGGFVDHGESLEEGAMRELKEEAGLEPDEYEPLQYLCSSPGTYPYEGETHYNTVALFWSRLKTDRDLIAQDDVAGMQWTDLHTLDLGLLHDDDIRAGVKVLRQMFP
jgi:ADP-ribose pyrophosphatase YjhB (NUDIX family)